MGNAPSRPWATAGLARVLPWLGCFCIVFLAPLIHVSALEEGWIVPKMAVMALGLTLMWIEQGRQAILGRTALRRTQLDGALLIFGIVAILSAAGSIDKPVSLLGQYRGPFHGLFAMAMYAAIFYAFVAQNEIRPDRLIDAVLAAGIVCCLNAFTQIGGGLDEGRVWGTFGAPIFLGSFLALLLPLAWGRARNGNVLGFVALQLGVVATVAAKARGASLSAAIGVLVYEVCSGNIAEAAIMGGTGLAFLLCWHPFRASSDLGRIEVYRAALSAWAHHPILGGGPDTFALLFRQYCSPRMNAIVTGDAWIQMSAHNDILQIAATMGTAGLAAYALLATKLFRDLYDNARVLREHRYILAALASVFVVAKFNPVHLAVIGICAAMAGIVCAWTSTPAKRNWPVFGVALASCVMFSLARQQMRAEYFVSYGNALNSQRKFFEASDMMHMAALANPLEIYYVDKELRQLWAVASGVDHGDMKRVSAAALNTADQAVRLHPNDPIAHDLRALALKDISIGFADNTIKQSQYEMERAVALAPTFKAYARDAMNIARVVGDRATEARHRAVLNRLLALEAGKL